MPGIFGLVNYHKGCINKSLKKMADRMSYSGIGHTDIWSDEENGIGLGHNTMENFCNEEQPVRINSDVSMLVHGEIVDADDIRKNLLLKGFDASQMGEASLVLMHYLTNGIEGVPKINGSIAVGIWDLNKRKLTLVPDRFGLRPLYYVEVNGTLAFASEIKSLLALEFFPKIIDEEAIFEFFAFEQLKKEQTFLKDIRKIPFGSVLNFSQEKVKIEECWPLLYHQPEHELSEREYIEKFIWLGKEAVKKRLKNNSIIGLSGGLDSRLLTALAIQEYHNLNTCTYGEKNSRDLVRGTEVAKVACLNNISLVLEDNYLQKYAEQMVDRVDGLFSVFNCHGMIVTEIASQYPIIAMANGLDQLLWSTRSHYKSDFINKNNISNALFEHENNGLIEKKNWKEWFAEDWYSKYAASSYDKFVSDANRIKLDSVDNSIDSYKLQLYLDYSSAGMPMISHKMEYTIPFYDNGLIEFILNLPLYMRWNRKLVKMAITQLSPQLAQIAGGPSEKESQWENFLRKAQKKGRNAFVRIGHWHPMQVKPPSSTFTNMHELLRLKNNSLWLEKNLLNSQTIISEIFKPKILHQLIYEHRYGLANHTSVLGVLLTVELYLRNIDGIS